MNRRAKRKLKELLRTTLFISLPVMCFMGALSSTVAWYSFNLKASLDYHGASISSAKQLQVGIKTDADLSGVGLVTDNGVAWSKPGNGLTPEQLQAYLENEGFATISLPALTSGGFTNGDDLSLKYSPSLEVNTSVVPANREDYVLLPLAFRVIKTSSGEYMPNQDIWITNADVKTNASVNIEDGVRVYFKSNNDSFIFHPGKNIEENYINVGGLMDLNFDEYYDTDENKYEIIYGDYEGAPTYVTQEVDSDYVDINKTGAEYHNTFYAKHRAGRQTIQSFEGVTFARQYFETLNDIKPVDSDSGYHGGKPVCTTASDTYIAETTMTIWLEGWDHVVIDSVTGFKFNLNLTFEINRV